MFPLANVENFTLALPRILGLLMGELGAAVKGYTLVQNGVTAQLSINFHGVQQRPSRRQRKKAALSGRRTGPSASSARPNSDSVGRLPASSEIVAPGPVACPTPLTVEANSAHSASPTAGETQQTRPPVPAKRRRVEQLHPSPVKSAPAEMVVGLPASPASSTSSTAESLSSSEDDSDMDSPSRPLSPWTRIQRRLPTSLHQFVSVRSCFLDLPVHTDKDKPCHKMSTGGAYSLRQVGTDEHPNGVLCTTIIDRVYHQVRIYPAMEDKIIHRLLATVLQESYTELITESTCKRLARVLPNLQSA